MLTQAPLAKALVSALACCSGRPSLYSLIKVPHLETGDTMDAYSGEWGPVWLNRFCRQELLYQGRAWQLGEGGFLPLPPPQASCFAMARPLLPELLQSSTQTQLAHCCRLVGLQVGRQNRAALEAFLQDKCQDEKAHKDVCRALMANFSTAALRDWLLHLRRVGCNIGPSTSWGGLGKEAMVAAFLRADVLADVSIPTQACNNGAGIEAQAEVYTSAPGCPAASQQTSTQAEPTKHLDKQKCSPQSSPVALHVHGLAECIRKLKRRRQSQAIIAALRSALSNPKYANMSIGELRAIVSDSTKISLDVGEPRLFFDRKLFNLTRRPEKKTRPQRKLELRLSKRSIPSVSSSH